MICVCLTKRSGNCFFLTAAPRSIPLAIPAAGSSGPHADRWPPTRIGKNASGNACTARLTVGGFTTRRGWSTGRAKRSLGTAKATASHSFAAANRPCNFFWIADDIVIDGYIRSDNRGTESIFPLFLETGNGSMGRTANFTEAFTSAAARLRANLNPQDLLHYIYALFHSVGYRERYKEQLCVDFPRVFLTRSVTLFWKLVGFGDRLVNLHLLREEVLANTPIDLIGSGVSVVHGGFPKYDADRVEINAQQYFAPIPGNAWQFHVGTYQVLRKWLKDRHRQQLTDSDVERYTRLATAIAGTLQTMDEIESAICQHGGWPNAFSS